MAGRHPKADIKLPKPKKKARRLSETDKEAKDDRSLPPVSRKPLTRDQIAQIEILANAIWKKQCELQEKVTLTRNIIYSRMSTVSGSQLDDLRQAINTMGDILSQAKNALIEADSIPKHINEIFEDTFAQKNDALQRISSDFSNMSVQVDNLKLKSTLQDKKETKQSGSLRPRKKIASDIPTDQKQPQPPSSLPIPTRNKHRKPGSGQRSMDTKNRPPHSAFFTQTTGKKPTIKYGINLALMQQFIRTLHQTGIQLENTQLASRAPTTIYYGLQACMFFIAETFNDYDFPIIQQDYFTRLRDNLVHGRSLFKNRDTEDVRLAYCDFSEKIASLTADNYSPFNLSWLEDVTHCYMI